MRVAALISAFVLVFAQLAFSQDEEGWISIPFAPEIGKTTRYEVTRIQEKIKDGASRGTQSVTSVDFVTPVARNESGLVYHMRSESITAEMDPPDLQPMMEKVFAALEGVVMKYQTDAVGTPVSVLNFEEVRAAANNAFSEMMTWLDGWVAELGLPPDQSAQIASVLNGVASAYTEMTPEQGNEQFLEGVRLLAFAAGSEYNINDAYQNSVEVPWAMTGTVLQMNIVFGVEEYRPQDNRATLWMETTFDPESVKAGLDTIYERISAASGGAIPPETLAQLQALSDYDISENYSVVVDLRTGEQILTDYTKSTTLGGQTTNINYIYKRLPAE